MLVKPYLVFAQNNACSSERVYEWYKWSEKDQWWLSEDGSGNGFSFEKVEKYQHLFTQHDTIEEVETFIKERKFASRWGNRVKDSFDFKCPKCGYHYVDGREYSGSEYDDLEVKCICGHHIKVVTSVKVTYEVVE